MKQLPVPDLRDTLDRYLAAVEPLLDADEWGVTQVAVAEFAAGTGPRCQAELRRYADVEQAVGHSWLSRAWLEGYLDVRTPLPLTSSVGFRIFWPSATSGIARAGEVLHAFADAHLAHLRGEVEPEITPRGEPVDPTQWEVVAGGLRHPRPDRDESRNGPPHAADREVGVLWRGRYLAMPISDSHGQPLALSALTATLAQIVGGGDGADDFAAWSNLGSDRVAAYLDELLLDPDNRTTYERLANALFVLRIGDEVADEAEHLRRCTFEPGQCWAYKPLTYQVQLADDFVAVHVEHSRIDGATLRELIQRAHAGLASADEAEPDASPLPTTELVWVMSVPVREGVQQELVEHQHVVDDHQIRIAPVPNPVPTGARVSLDAVQQWLMLYAQWATYGRVRSTYEAVDMREYEAGRTECLRPTTRAAVALVRSLTDGTVEPDQVRSALDAHRTWVKAAKSGHGVDRHLLGLRLAADRLGLASPLHVDDGYRRLSTDFLSTTSIGDRSEILRCGFAPTSEGGVGFYYSPSSDNLEFTVCFRASAAEQIDELVRNLHRGAAALAAPLQALRD